MLHAPPAADNALELLRRRWQQLCLELLAPDVELTVEEFTPVLSAFKQLLAAGHEFDPALMVIMAVLERQCSETADGFEDDTDTDEDGSDSFPPAEYIYSFFPPLPENEQTTHVDASLMMDEQNWKKDCWR